MLRRAPARIRLRPPGQLRQAQATRRVRRLRRGCSDGPSPASRPHGEIQTLETLTQQPPPHGRRCVCPLCAPSWRARRRASTTCWTEHLRMPSLQRGRLPCWPPPAAAVRCREATGRCGTTRARRCHPSRLREPGAHLDPDGSRLVLDPFRAGRSHTAVPVPLPTSLRAPLPIPGGARAFPWSPSPSCRHVLCREPRYQ